MRLVWQRQAREELFEAIRHYRHVAGDRVAREFVHSVTRTAGRLCAFPALGIRCSDAIRRFSLHGYPYDVIYRADAVAVVIIALAHHARRPGYWAGRR